LSKRFKGHPAVIGYDLINEPTKGDWESQLLPLYNHAAKIIHKNDPTKIIFVEPVGGRLSLGPGLTIAPSMAWQKPAFTNYSLATHYYDLQVLALGGPVFGSLTDFTNSEVQKIADLAKAWNAPVWLGEFGTPAITKRGHEVSRLYMEKLYAQWNKHLFSGAEWAYTPNWNPITYDGWNYEDGSIVDDKGNFRHFRMRPYAERISGEPLEMVDNLDKNKRTESFSVVWENKPAAGKTVIFAPRSIFPGDVFFTVQPAEMECKYDENTWVECRSKNEGKHKLVIHTARE
jgi:hypothetical protein